MFSNVCNTPTFVHIAALLYTAYLLKKISFFFLSLIYLAPLLLAFCIFPQQPILTPQENRIDMAHISTVLVFSHSFSGEKMLHG